MFVLRLNAKNYSFIINSQLMFSSSFKHLILCSLGLFSSMSGMAQFGGGVAGGNTKSDLQPEQTRTYSSLGLKTQTQVVHDGSSIEFSDVSMSGTKIMYATITDNAGGNFLDTVQVGVTTYNTELFNTTSRKFVPRRYSITPKSDGPATVTLYFTQAEFDAYNVQAAYNYKLPIDGTDAENYKANLNVYRCIDNYETPNLIAIASPTVSWNATNLYWAVTFNVPNFIGGNYYIATPFLTNKMVTGITHTSQTPSICETSATVTVDWDTIIGASDYRVRFRAQGNPSWNTSTITPSFRVIPNLSFSTTYEVQVRARENADTNGNTNIQGEYSQTYSFTTPAAPLYPVCVSPSPSVTAVSQNSATITWPAILDATGYMVQMRVNGSATWGGTTIQGTSYTFSGLTPSTTYYYRVRTNCNLTNACSLYSQYSSEGSFTTSAQIVVPVTCMPPTNLQISAIGTNGATLSWTAAANAQSYFIQIKPSVSSTWGGNSTTNTSRVYTNLSPNTSYDYRIRSSCTGTVNNNSVFTSVGTFTTNPLVAPTIFEQHENTWSVFPNPAHNVVNIQFNAEQETPMQFQLFDITGRLVKTVVETPVKGNNQMEFNLEALSKGIYMMKVSQQNKVLHIQRLQKN